MIIDLSKLIISTIKEIEINEEINISEELLQKTQIKKLNNVQFKGKIKKLIDDTFEITGNLSGIMILPDDVTLEDTEVYFDTNIEQKISEFDNNIDNNIKIVQKTIDIIPILWQNIVVEIPLKVVNKNRETSLKGEGWRLVTEEELEKEKVANSPFSELQELLDSRKELK